MPSEIALSICLTGRNDNYTPDFTYRMATTINFFAMSAAAIGRSDDVELIVVDWGSDVPLSEVLDLSEEAVAITRFLWVPAEITSRYPAASIPSNIAQNIGMRRSRGKLVGICGAELLIPASSLRSILSIVDGDSGVPEYPACMFLCGRYRLPLDWVLAQPSPRQWNEYLRFNSWKIEQEFARGAFLTGNASLFLIPREILNESRGLFEALDPGWGWNDVEYTMRISSRYPVFDLNANGVQIYDMEHIRVEGEREVVFKRSAERLLSQNFACNEENWGANDITIEFYRAELPSKAIVGDKHDLWVKHYSRSDDSRFIDFLMWGSTAIGYEPDISEIQLLYVLYGIFSKMNVLYYKEYGLCQGVSFYLAGALSPHCSLIGVDAWERGAGEYGPDHIAYNLALKGVSHQGALRLINKNISGDQVQDNFCRQLLINGVVLCRVNSRDCKESVAGELSAYIGSEVVVVAGEEAGDYVDFIRGNKCLAESCILLSEGVGVILPSTVLDTGLQAFIFPSPNKIKFFQHVLRRSVDISKFSADELARFFASDKEGRWLVTGDEKKISSFWPLFESRVLAIISTDFKSPCSEVPVIELEDIESFEEALMVRF